MDKLGLLSIENGQPFENLLQVVDHYSRTADGCYADWVIHVQYHILIVQDQPVHSDKYGMALKELTHQKSLN